MYPILKRSRADDRLMEFFLRFLFYHGPDSRVIANPEPLSFSMDHQSESLFK